MNPSPTPALPAVPEPLQGLVDLALDVRWAWSHSSDVLWRRLAPQVWERTHSPWRILQTIAQTKLQEFARDEEFVDLVRRHIDERDQTLSAPSWYAEHWQKMPPDSPTPSPLLGQIAYFSMEFGLTEALPIYSGGLGILAGDYLKAASDLGVPLVGLGILWQQGYFRQALNADGEQIEFFPFNDPGQLPITPLRDSRGEWVSVDSELPPADGLSAGVGGQGRPGHAVPARRERPPQQRRGQRHHERALRRGPGDEAAAGAHPRHRRLESTARARHRSGDLPLERGPRRLCRPRAGALLHGRQRGRVRRSALRDQGGQPLHHPYRRRGGLRQIPDELVREYLGEYIQELGSDMERVLTLGASPDGDSSTWPSSPSERAERSTASAACTER